MTVGSVEKPKGGKAIKVRSVGPRETRAHIRTWGVFVRESGAKFDRKGLRDKWAGNSMGLKSRRWDLCGKLQEGEEGPLIVGRREGDTDEEQRGRVLFRFIWIVKGGERWECSGASRS